jgi:hypothetical protein
MPWRHESKDLTEKKWEIRQSLIYIKYINFRGDANFGEEYD